MSSNMLLSLPDSGHNSCLWSSQKRVTGWVRFCLFVVVLIKCCCCRPLNINCSQWLSILFLLFNYEQTNITNSFCTFTVPEVLIWFETVEWIYVYIQLCTLMKGTKERNKIPRWAKRAHGHYQIGSVKIQTQNLSSLSCPGSNWILTVVCIWNNRPSVGGGGATIRAEVTHFLLWGCNSWHP